MDNSGPKEQEYTTKIIFNKKQPFEICYQMFKPPCPAVAQRGPNQPHHSGMPPDQPAVYAVFRQAKLHRFEPVSQPSLSAAVRTV